MCQHWLESVFVAQLAQVAEKRDRRGPRVVKLFQNVVLTADELVGVSVPKL